MNGKTLGLLAGGAILGAVAMRLSMQQRRHVQLPAHFAAAGAGVALGAVAVHLLSK